MRKEIRKVKKILQRYCISQFIPLCLLSFILLISFVGRVLYSELHVYPAVFLIRLKDVYIDNLPLLFAASLSYYMTKKDPSAIFSGIISYLILTQIINPDTLSNVFSLTYYDIHYSFSYTENALSGIASGLLAACVYHWGHRIQMPASLAFFSGKRIVPVLTGFMSILLAFLFYLTWPSIYTSFISVHFHLTQGDALAEAVSAFLNLLLVPIGMEFFSEQFILTTNIQHALFIYSRWIIPCSLLLIMIVKRKQTNVQLLLILLLLTSLLNQRCDLLLITLLMISPLLWLSHCLLFSFFCLLLTLWSDAQIPLTAGFTILYLCITFQYLKRKKLELLSAGDKKSYNDDMLMQFIHCMGDLENIRSLRSEGTDLIVDVYDPELFDSGALKQLSGWNLQRDASSYILHTDADAAAIRKQIEAINAKDSENLIL